MKVEEDFEETILNPIRPEAMLFFPVIMKAAPDAPESFTIVVPGQRAQTIVPDDCQFADNSLCYSEA